MTNKLDKKRQFGLIGYPLSHSFSPGYFAEKFEHLQIKNCRYDLYPMEQISMVKGLLNGDIEGLNVTIPYKEQVIPYLTELSEEAKEIGAVNTIKIHEDRVIGYNTDVYGFEQSLMQICGDALPSKGLILGSGGASKAVRYVLKKHKCDYPVSYTHLTLPTIA